MKNLHLDLVRVTESGALAAAQWVGRGDKESADLAATNAIRERLNGMDFCGRIAIGEGIKDESHGLYEGEIVGAKGRFVQSVTPEHMTGDAAFDLDEPDPEFDIAVDPIEGTTPTAKGGTEAMSVIAMGNIGSLYKTECFYMDKLAVGPKIRGKVHIDNPPKANVAIVAAMLGKEIQHVTVCVLDRPRTKPLIEELRRIGCRIKFISDCDVTACIAACEPDNGIDMYWSIGGAPEAVIAAAAMKCMGGFIQCREVESDASGEIWTKANDNILGIEDLAKGPVMFSATGITDGQLLSGVRFTEFGPITHTMAMRSGSGTIRRIETRHGN